MFFILYFFKLLKIKEIKLNLVYNVSTFSVLFLYHSSIISLMKGNSRKYFFITILALYLCTDSRVMAQKWEKIGSEFNNIGKLVYVNGTQLFVIIEDKRYSQN